MTRTLFQDLQIDRVLDLAGKMKIKDQTSSKEVLWVLTAPQKRVLRELCAGKQYIAILKSRQMGLSTAACFADAIVMIAHKGINVGLVANNQTNADSLLKKVRSFLLQMGVGSHKPNRPFEVDTHKQLKLWACDGGSSLVSITVQAPNAQKESAGAGRSHTFDHLHYTERDFYADPRAFGTISSAATLPCVRIVETTASSPYGDMAALWREEPSRWTKLFFSVESHPAYVTESHLIPDSKWEQFRTMGFRNRGSAAFVYQKARNEFLGDLQAAGREYPATIEMAFAGSGDRWITRDPIISPYRWVGNCKIFREPDVSQRYIIAIDTAKGTGRDFSALVVFSRTTMTLCAYLRNNKIHEKEVLEDAKNMMAMYKVESLHIEETGMGRSMVVLAQEKHIPVVAFDTNLHNKVLGLLLAKEHMEAGEIGDNDLAQECADIRRNGDKFTGRKDLLMALGFALRYAKQDPHEREPVYQADDNTFKPPKTMGAAWRRR